MSLKQSQLTTVVLSLQESLSKGQGCVPATSQTQAMMSVPIFEPVYTAFSLRL